MTHADKGETRLTRRSVVWILLLGGCAGLLLRELPLVMGKLGLKPGEVVQSLSEHIGEAILIASVVTALLHVAEFQAFFKQFVSHVMLDKAFLHDLKPKVLHDFRARASEVLVADAVSNPAYDWKALYSCIDDLLIACLPKKGEAGSGMHRRKYIEDVTVEYLTLEQVLAEIGEDASGLSDEMKRREMVRMEGITLFQLVAPGIDAEAVEKLPFEVRLDECPGIPPEKLVRLSQGETVESQTEIALKFVVNDGIVTGTASPTVHLREGVGKVYRKAVAYQQGETAPYLLDVMKCVTHEATVRLAVRSSRGGEIRVEGSLVGGAGGELTPRVVRDGIAMEFTGWLLKGHGFFLYWWGPGTMLGQAGRTS